MKAVLSTPVPRHRVSGHFDGTDVKFTIYLPPARQWQGRFFQYTYPTSTENAPDRAVAVGAASGAYTVQTSGTGGSTATCTARPPTGTPAACPSKWPRPGLAARSRSPWSKTWIGSASSSTPAKESPC